VETIGQDVVCESCGRRFAWKTQLAGKRVKCKCGVVLSFPEAGERGEEGEEVPVEAGAVCPHCHGQVPPGAVLCTQCGTDLRTGRRLGSQVMKADLRAARAGSGRRSRALVAVGVCVVILAGMAVAAVMYGGTLLEMAKGTHGPNEAARGFFADVQRGDIAHARSGAMGKIDEKYLQKLHNWFGQQGYRGWSVTEDKVKNDLVEVNGRMQFGGQVWQTSMIYRNEGGKWVLTSVMFMGPHGELMHSVIQL
jgi:hypothetical protein